MNKKLLSVFMSSLLFVQPLAMSNTYAKNSPGNASINLPKKDTTEDRKLPTWAKITMIGGGIALPFIGGILWKCASKSDRNADTPASPDPLSMTHGCYPDEISKQPDTGVFLLINEGSGKSYLWDSDKNGWFQPMVDASTPPCRLIANEGEPPVAVGENWGSDWTLIWQPHNENSPTREWQQERWVETERIPFGHDEVPSYYDQPVPPENFSGLEESPRSQIYGDVEEGFSYLSASIGSDDDAFEPESEPEPKLQQEPEPKLQQEPEPKLQQEPEPELQQEPESKPQQEPEPELQQEPEPKLQQEPESKPQQEQQAVVSTFTSGTDGDDNADSMPQVDNQESEARPASEPQVDNQESEARPAPEPQVDNQESQALSEPDHRAAESSENRAPEKSDEDSDASGEPRSSVEWLHFSNPDDGGAGGPSSSAASSWFGGPPKVSLVEQLGKYEPLLANQQDGASVNADGGNLAAMSASSIGSASNSSDQEFQEVSASDCGTRSSLTASCVNSGVGGAASASAIVEEPGENRAPEESDEGHDNAEGGAQPSAKAAAYDHGVQLGRANRLLEQYSTSSEQMADQEVIKICENTQRVLERENALLEINKGGKVIIVGDLHANLGSALHSCKRFLHEYEKDPRTCILFLGDYVDRGYRAPGGPQSVKVVTLLSQMKQLFPDNFFLLRGNHEDDSVNDHYGLKGECSRRKQLVFQKLNEMFRYLSLAAVINGHVFCVHGGISPELTLDKIRAISKPTALNNAHMDEVIKDMLWSDPYDDDRLLEENGFAYNDDRRVGKFYGGKAVDAFYKANPGLDCIVRAHEALPEGYDTKFGSVHTVFSAFNYSNLVDNTAEILIYDGSTRGFTEEIIPIHETLAEYINPSPASAGEDVDKAS